jgi:hypothetical protein
LVLTFRQITLETNDRSPHVEHLSLHEDLTSLNLELADEVQAELEIVPTSRDLGQIEVDLPLVDLSSSTGDKSTRWTLPFAAQKAVFGIRTEAVIPTKESPDSPSYQERRAAVRRFVEENLKVFVDVSGVDSDGPSTAEVQWFWPPRDGRNDPLEWRAQLEEEIGPMDEEARVEVFIESDEEVLLIEAEGEVGAAPVDSAEDNEPN